MTWPTVTLNALQADEPRAITDGPFGSNLASRHYTESGPRVVRLQNIGDGRFVDERAHISEEHFEALRAHEVKAGDLLVASLGEVLPRACLAPASLGPAIVKADCIRVRLSHKVDPRWVLYALQRPDVRRWADAHRHGVGRPRLGLRVIRQVPIPLPPLDEQHRIVDLLEDHLSRLDAADAYLDTARRRAPTLVQEGRESIWRDVSERVPIGELGQVVTGRTPPTTDPLSVGVDIPFVTPGDVGYGVEVRRVGRRISHHGATASRVIPGGSVLAVCIGATLGKVGFSGVPVAFNQQINGVVLPQIEDAELLASLLAAPSFQSAMWQASSATTMPLLNKSTFSQLEVPLVPSGRRAEFLAKTRSAGEAVDRVGTDVDRAFTRSAALRRSLLAAAFSGRLTTELPQTAESTLAV